MEILKLTMDLKPTQLGVSMEFGASMQKKVREILEEEEHDEIKKYLKEVSRVLNNAIERDMKKEITELVSLIDEELSVTVKREEEELNEVDKEDIRKEVELFFDNLEKLLTKK